MKVHFQQETGNMFIFTGVTIYDYLTWVLQYPLLFEFIILGTFFMNTETIMSFMKHKQLFQECTCKLKYALLFSTPLSTLALSACIVMLISLSDVDYVW